MGRTKGSLTTGKCEWSFGNGADGDNHRQSGYTMMTCGRILRIGITAFPATETVTVSSTVNGVETRYFVRKPAGSYSEVKVFDTPLELTQGDRLNFITNQTASVVKCAVVNVLIELDL